MATAMNSLFNLLDIQNWYDLETSLSKDEAGRVEHKVGIGRHVDGGERRKRNREMITERFTRLGNWLWRVLPAMLPFFLYYITELGSPAICNYMHSSQRVERELNQVMFQGPAHFTLSTRPVPAEYSTENYHDKQAVGRARMVEVLNCHGRMKSKRQWSWGQYLWAQCCNWLRSFSPDLPSTNPREFTLAVTEDVNQQRYATEAILDRKRDMAMKIVMTNGLAARQSKQKPETSDVLETYATEENWKNHHESTEALLRYVHSLSPSVQPMDQDIRLVFVCHQDQPPPNSSTPKPNDQTREGENGAEQNGVGQDGDRQDGAGPLRLMEPQALPLAPVDPLLDPLSGMDPEQDLPNLNDHQPVPLDGVERRLVPLGRVGQPLLAANGIEPPGVLVRRNQCLQAEQLRHQITPFLNDEEDPTPVFGDANQPDDSCPIDDITDEPLFWRPRGDQDQSVGEPLDDLEAIPYDLLADCPLITLRTDYYDLEREMEREDDPHEECRLPPN